MVITAEKEGAVIWTIRKLTAQSTEVVFLYDAAVCGDPPLQFFTKMVSFLLVNVQTTQMLELSGAVHPSQ